jgi:hypothetical protein
LGRSHAGIEPDPENRPTSTVLPVRTPRRGEPILMERIHPHGFLKREGMTYRINTRAALWLIVMAVVCGLVVWWSLT